MRPQGQERVLRDLREKRRNFVNEGTSVDGSGEMLPALTIQRACNAYALVSSGDVRSR